jgi:thiamine pyrophosphate-dependent acetolactate synthase large subunit-like protein
VSAQGLEVPPATHSWPSPAFRRVARGYGMRAVTARTPRELAHAARDAINAPHPVLVEAIVDPDAATPGASARFIHLGASERRS